MKKKFIIRIIILLIIFLCISFSYKIYLSIKEKNYIDHNFQNIKQLESVDSLDSYSFAVVSNIKNSDDVFKKKIIPDINSNQDIKFLISTGESVLDGAEEKYRLLNKALNTLNVPSIIGIGENEIADQGYNRYYNHFGQAYFSFTFNNDYFIFLDSTRTTSFEVIESWLDDELNKAQSYNNIFVIMDSNPLNIVESQNTNFHDNLTKIFSDNSVTAVFFTDETYQEMIVNNVKYYSCGKAGGISNNNDYGYVIFDVNKNNTSVNYLEINAKFNAPIIRIWVGFWYGMHTLFYVHFINIVIILSSLLILSLIIYIFISKDTDYYRDFSNQEKLDLKNKELSIAMFTNNYFPFIGGVPISIYRISKALRKDHHKVVIFAPKYPKDNGKDKNIIRCPLLKYSTSGKFPFAIANIYAPKIEKIFNKYTFDIVHVHHPFWMGKKGLKLAKKKDIPVILTYHTRLEKYSENLPFGKLFFKNVFSHKMIKRFSQKCDGIIAPTKSAKEYLENIGVSRPKLIMPTGIDISAYDNIDKERIASIRNKYVNEDELLLCSVFRLSPEKNGDFLIEGLKKVNENTTKKFKCIIIGDGPEKDELQNKINSLGMENNIILCGKVPPEDIYAYYIASDLFVFTSKSETQGMVLLEAMAGGDPVVSINSSGVDDVIINDFNGYKTNDNLNQWSDLVTKLIEDKDLLNKMSENAIKFANKYSIDNLAAKLETFYKTIIIHKRKKQ